MSFESVETKNVISDMESIIGAMFDIKKCIHIYSTDCGVTKCKKCNLLRCVKRLEPIKDYIHCRWMIKN